MAWAEQIPGIGRWRGQYRDASGRRRTTLGCPWSTKAAALRRAGAEEDYARQRPGRVAPKAGRMTWGAWCDEWWPCRGVELGTLARDLSRRNAHLEPRWATVRPVGHRPGRGAGQVRRPRRHGTGRVDRRELLPHLLSASLKAAMRAGKIQSSPYVCRSCCRSGRHTYERFLTWTEVEAITHFMQPRDALLVNARRDGGPMRRSGRGAPAPHAPGRGRFDVHEVWDQKIRRVKSYPEGRSKRSVPLPGWLAGKLKTHLAGIPAPATCRSVHRRGSRCRSGLVLPGRDEKVIDYDPWRSTKWADAFSKAEIGDVTIHDLRHTYASWLIQDGVPIEALCDLLGHALIATTMRYAHLAQSHWKSVVAVLDARSAPILPQVDQGDSAHDPRVVRFRSSDGA